MPGRVFIEGEAIDLRVAEEEDVPFLQDAVGGAIPYTRQGYERERYDLISEREVLELLVCEDDRRVGWVSLAPIDERRGWANLGYWIHPDHRDQGYATEASRLSVTHGFEELRLHRISATIDADNDPSRRVVEKLGFVHEGTKRDDQYREGEYVDREVYAVLADEWNGAD